VQSTRVAFGAPPRKEQEPLTITGRWPRTITNSCHNSSAALSHLGGDNHQEKQEIHSHNDPQVPIDAITQANTLELLNLTLNSQSSKRNEWEGVCSAQRMLSQVRRTKRVSKGRLTSLYRRPKKIEPLAPLTVLISVLIELATVDRRV
jgi:hypothetical protein